MSTIQRVILDGFWTYTAPRGCRTLSNHPVVHLEGTGDVDLAVLMLAGQTNFASTLDLSLRTSGDIDATRPELAIHDDDDDELSCTNTAVLYIIQSFCSGTFKNLQLK